MDSEEKLKQQVTEVAKSFFAEHMSLKPESIVVDIHSDCLVIALEKLIPRAEKAYIQEALSQDRLERFYKGSYDVSKLVFETAVGEFFPRRITGSCMSVHPALDRCVIVVSVCSGNSKQAQLG
jgi:hypothetical protein